MTPLMFSFKNGDLVAVFSETATHEHLIALMMCSDMKDEILDYYPVESEELQYFIYEPYWIEADQLKPMPSKSENIP